LGAVGGHEKGFGAWSQICVFRISQNGTQERTNAGATGLASNDCIEVSCEASGVRAFAATLETFERYI
jgi:hypothetical protein